MNDESDIVILIGKIVSSMMIVSAAYHLGGFWWAVLAAGIVL
jgi:hypothetical protein